MSRSILTIRVRKYGAMGYADEQDLPMRTPGNDEELAAGFLFAERIVRRPGDIDEIKCSLNTAAVTLGEGSNLDFEANSRNFYTTSNCGASGKASLKRWKAQAVPPYPATFPRRPNR